MYYICRDMKKILFIFLIVHCTLNIDNCLCQWVQVNNGMGNQPVVSLTSSGSNIFAGTYGGGGVYLSTNNGTSWTLTSLNNQYVISFAVNGNNIFAGTDGIGVYLSTNNGTIWTQAGLNSRSVPSLAVNGINIFAGTDYGVYLSTNNGTNWTLTSLQFTIGWSLAVSGSNIFAGTQNNGVYLSTNNGTNWTQTSLNNQNVYSLAVNGNNIFAGTGYPGNGLYLSTNNGTTWTQTSLNNVSAFSLAVNGNNIFAGIYLYNIYDGVMVSNDNGGNWIQRNEGFPKNTSVYAFCILNNYIFGGTGNCVYRRPLNELIGIQPISNEVPNQFSLSQNYPNPFNPSTVISFQLAVNSFASLKVYDLLGREVATLVNEKLQPGTYEVDWDGTNYSSGLYYYKLVAAGFTETKKMVLIK